MGKVRAFIERNPVRVAALVSSLVAVLLAVVNPDIPVDPAIVFVLSALGLGEYAQRKENSKTLAASEAPRKKR